MKKIPKSPLILLIIFLSIIIYSNVDISKKLIFVFSKKDVNINHVLQQQHYKLSNNNKEKYLYVGIYKNYTIKFEKYKVKNHDVININIPYKSKLILTLNSDRNLSYVWNIKNMDEASKLILEEKSVITPMSSLLHDEWNKLSIIRDVFYLVPQESGYENLLLRLSSFNDDDNPSLFDIDIHVNIAK
ncbi:hypothetical protein SH2C18_41260 [Clostridium sediminicola]|uniref:hypothetical protein n=1 Tax=Clostridium sediminicola TaxID=3114879 RepID=UPI0031F1D15B